MRALKRLFSGAGNKRRFIARTLKSAQLHTAAKFIKIWQFGTEFGKFDFTFTQVDDVAAVADLEQQHPDWKEFLRNWKAYSDLGNHLFFCKI